MIKRTCITYIAILTSLLLLLIGCQANDEAEVDSYQEIVRTSPSGKYIRPLNDGAPWWEVDVTSIPDATPTPHTGTYKKNPYTVFGKTYYPKKQSSGYKETGMASWYGTKFHGKSTANGETYDLYGMTAAHKTLPLPSYVKVTNLQNGRSVVVRVNDRGPFHSNRIIDLSFAAAKKLGYADAGTARVSIESVDPKQPAVTQKTAIAKAKPTKAKPIAAKTKLVTQTKQPIDDYQPPADQHATADNTVLPKGLYLQAGAFANPDAAELYRQRLVKITKAPVFISSVAQGKQQLYRVRLGPLPNQQEIAKIQNTLSVAKLGQPTLVKQD